MNRAFPEGLPPPTDDEAELARVEPAWALFAYALRTGHRLGRWPRNPEDEHLLADSLVQVTGVLDAYREAHARGEPMALLNAAAYCGRERVPLPTWLAEALDGAVREFSRPDGRGSLDAILAPGVPTTGARALAWRRALPFRARLMRDVGLRMARDGLSRDAAVREALAAGRYPFQRATALRLFDEDARRQRQFLRKRG